MLPLPEGLWGMPRGRARDDDRLRPGRREEPGRGAQDHGRASATAPDNPLKVKVSTRDIAIYRDPAVILIDQLKKIYIDGELEVIDTTHLASPRSRARTTRSA